MFNKIIKIFLDSDFLLTLFQRIPGRILIFLREIILVFSFAFLTGILSKVKFEIGAVPITLQTLAVLLSGAILGSLRGSLSQLIYLLCGLSGIPWFSRGGGITYLMSPTFGYLIGFIFAAFLIGYLLEKGLNKKIQTAILAMLSGNLVLYLPGLLWLARFTGFEKVLKVGFYPFLFSDLLKIILATLILSCYWKIVKLKKR